MMKRQHWILAILLAVAAGYWLLGAMGTPTPNSLAARALAAARPEERADAVAQLTLMQDPQSAPQLRRLAAESKDPDVVVTAINTLATSSNPDSLSLFLNTLGHEDPRARDAAYRAVLLGRDVPTLEAAGYEPNDPPDKRALALVRLKEAVKEKVPEKSLRVLVAESRMREAGLDPAKDPTTPSVAPVPPSPSVAPTTEMGGATPVQDHPAAIQLLVWLCRGLAIVVLLAAVAGAVSLLLGERDPFGADRKKDARSTSPSVEEQLAKILASRPASRGADIARVLAGAVCAVALLVVAEMMILAVRVDQRAASMDQKLDVLSRGR